MCRRSVVAALSGLVLDSEKPRLCDSVAIA
jgi:hypothetical protein